MYRTHFIRTVMLFIALALSMSGCNFFVSQFQQHERVVGLHYATRITLDRIEDSYNKRDWQKRAQQASYLIAEFNKVPLAQLQGLHLLLIERIEKSGYRPFMDILLEFGYRLAHAPTSESQNIFRKFQLSDLWDSDRKQFDPEYEEIPVMIRGSGSDTYRLISANAANAALLFMFSDRGFSYLSMGYRPEYFVRLSTLATNCRRTQEERSKTRVTFTIALAGQSQQRNSVTMADRKTFSVPWPCETLIDQLARGASNTGAGQRGLDGALDALTGGMTIGAKSCIALLGDRTMQEQVNELDQRVSCEQSARSQWGSPSFDPRGSLLIGNEFGYHSGTEIDNKLRARGFQETGGYSGFIDDQAITGKWSEHNSGMLFTSSTYEHPNGNQVTVSTEYWGNGNITTTVTESSPQGTTIHTYSGSEGGSQLLTQTNFHNSNTGESWQTNYQYNDSNQMTGMNVSGPTGTVNHTVNPGTNRITNTSWQGNDGSSYDATYNDNGSLASETITDCSGGSCQTTEVSYDENGSCTSNCDTHASAGNTASTPVGEDPIASECTQRWAQKFEEEVRGRGGLDPLGPLIYPNPDNVQGNVEGMCFSEFENAKLRECKSVALCLNDAAFGGDCNCAAPLSQLGTLEGSRSNVCTQIQCAEGASCDPNTGTCKTADGGSFEPGIIIFPPISPVTTEIPEIPTGSMDFGNPGQR